MIKDSHGGETSPTRPIYSGATASKSIFLPGAVDIGRDVELGGSQSGILSPPMLEARDPSDRLLARIRYQLQEKKSMMTAGGMNMTTRSPFMHSERASDALPTVDEQCLLRPDCGIPITRPLRVLLVDDSAVNKRMLVRLLQRALPTHVTLDVTDASDGAEGLRELTAHTSAGGGDAGGVAPSPSTTRHFDICLLDAEMPVMNGYDMAAAARAAKCAVPIIGITGNTLQADVHRFFSAGAKAVVSKPVRTEQLLRAMRDQLPWL